MWLLEIKITVCSFLLLCQVPSLLLGMTCDVSKDKRFDCFPDEGATQEKCEARGCCWSPAQINRADKVFANGKNVGLDTPYCFYPSDFGGYRVVERSETSSGFQLHLQLQGKGGPYGDNLETLTAEFIFHSKETLRVKIRDVAEKRYKVPIPISEPSDSQSQSYEVSYTSFPFGFKVVRRSTGVILFDSSVGGFIFSNQFIQLSSLLPSNNIYGLGEHVLGLKLSTKWTELTLFSRDAATPKGGYNLYGVHPFYMNIENDGNANGVFLLNSNAMDVILQPTPAITYRTIGGILDFSLFLGPSPDAVMKQYTDVVGKPVLPPYWALGFHLCRWGYNSVDGMKTVLDRMQKSGIPQDVQWNDIDYMSAKRDFTVDPKGYKNLGALVDELHQKGMHYVLITDPAISNTNKDYEPYTNGLEKNVFIKDADGDVLIGKVWPGTTVFPDFFHPNASIYWVEEMAKLHKEVSFDGLWIDMNEPSNFVPGSSKGCPSSSYETPPYTPHVLDGALRDKTICMTAKQYLGLHYNLHSLYGFSEGVVTMSALEKIRERRSLVIGRSTFSGSGAHQGHWLGDNHSTWDDLYASIAGMLNFNLFAIPLVGADICGFMDDTTEELCSRWMQLGAFYPFSRNHNTIGARDQDPAAFGELLIEASRSALLMRYKLLPFLNTLFFNAHISGSAVARPLFYEFPSDPKTRAIDSQFMWGESLLITPVLTQGAKSVRGYFPKGTWYDLHDGEAISSSGEEFDLQGGFDRVNLHLRHGHILPVQRPGLTTTASRRNPFGLLVAPDETGMANGLLYLDDGDVLDPIKLQSFSLVAIHLKNNSVQISPVMTKYTPSPSLTDLTIFGIASCPTQMMVNGHLFQNFTYQKDHQVLSTTSLNINIIRDNVISWDWSS